MNKTNMDFYSTCSTFFPRANPRNIQSRELATRTTPRLERTTSERKRKEVGLKFAGQTRGDKRKGWAGKPLEKGEKEGEALGL